MELETANNINMFLRNLTVVLSLSFLTSCLILRKGPTSPRLIWTRFDSFGLSMGVPENWHTRIKSSAKLKFIEVTKEPSENGTFMTGLTVTLIESCTNSEFNSEVINISEQAEKLYNSFSSAISYDIVEPTILDGPNYSTIILEGIKKVPKQPTNSDYHTRTKILIFERIRTIYIFTFRSPVDAWTKEYVTGQKMQLMSLDALIDD